MFMIKNVDTAFFRKILELDARIYEDFFNFVTEIIDLKDNITYDDFLVFKSSIFNQLANNNYSFENIDDLIRERVNKSYDVAILKLYSYMNYLGHSKKIDLNDKVDVLKYYGDINNIDERIFPYSNDHNIDCVNLQDVLNYIVMIGKQGKKDDIALSIILNAVSLKETEKYYEQLIEKLKNFCIKYKDVIEELEYKKLMGELFEYFQLSKRSDKCKMFHKMIEYLKGNNLRKDKIYTVLKKVEELQIDQLNINVECQISSEIYNVRFSKFQKAYYNEKNNEQNETIENGYAGTYIYTDGAKNWLIKTESANPKNNFEDTYTIEISNFKYVLLNDKQIDWGDDCIGPFFGPYLDRITKLQIYDFDMDISILPSYEDLNSFKISPQIDSIQVEEKTKAVDTILEIESTIKDVKKLLDRLKKLQEKLQIIKDSNEYTDVFSQIKSLENLMEQMEAMKSTTCAEYLKQGITELEKIKTLKNK